MIGVIPDPAEMKRSFSGGGSGSTNVPSTPPRRTMSPGRAFWLKKGETMPSSTVFGVIEIQPSGRSGSDVSE